MKAGSELIIGNFMPGIFNRVISDSVLGEAVGPNITEVNGSGIEAQASFTEIKENMDTRISVKASGMEPGGQYISIYYKNGNCEKEINSFEKSVNGAFFADEYGQGFSEGVVKDSVNRIGSISIRRAADFKLVACGRV